MRTFGAFIAYICPCPHKFCPQNFKSFRDGGRVDKVRMLEKRSIGKDVRERKKNHHITNNNII